jgi:hypothetical protein
LIEELMGNNPDNLDDDDGYDFDELFKIQIDPKRSLLFYKILTYLYIKEYVNK